MEDILIIGGGIIGSLIAYQCSKFHCNVTLLDKENDIANETTMANSAIIHAGYDPEEYTMKARMNVRGARLYASLCRELKVDYKQVGSLVLARNEEELNTLRKLAQRAKKRGINTEILNRSELLMQEKNLSDEVIYGLRCPQTAIVTPWKVAIAAIETAMANQVKCELNQEVIAIEKMEDGFLVKTQEKEYRAQMVINCAGLHADDVHEMACGTRDFEILPRRGEYFVLSKDCAHFVNHVLYPCPTEAGKGVLVVPTVHGNILLGPNAENINEKENVDTTKNGLEYIRESVGHLVKNVPWGEVIHSFSGLRPASDRNDFIIEESRVKDFIDVAGIESPGLASAPAIAEYVFENFIEPKFHFSKRLYFSHRQKNIEIAKCSDADKKMYIEHNPRYGEIVCRCEQISVQEIVNCIKRNCGARSVVAVKKRVRPGMGKCQGGFCEPMVVKILAETLGISPLEVDYNKKNSPVLLAKKGEDE